MHSLTRSQTYASSTSDQHRANNIQPNQTTLNPIQEKINKMSPKPRVLASNTPHPHPRAHPHPHSHGHPHPRQPIDIRRTREYKTAARRYSSSPFSLCLLHIDLFLGYRDRKLTGWTQMDIDDCGPADISGYVLCSLGSEWVFLALCYFCWGVGGLG